MESETVPHAFSTGKRVVVLAPNWLGDAVMALPAIADVRRHANGAAISVAARPSVSGLFQLMPGLDGVITLGRTAQAVSELRAGMFDAALLLPNSFYSASIAWRAGIAERWGFRAQGRSMLLTRRVAKPAGGHHAVVYQHLVRQLGVPNGPLEPRLVVAPGLRDAAARLLSDAGWNGSQPLVALAPGAAYGGAKRWPAERFAAVARALADDGIGTVLVGGRGDAPAAEEVRRGSSGVLSVVGATDVPTLAGVLIHCRALVSNDSGAMHLGAALGVPVTAMFGPTNEHETHPLGAEGARPPVVLTHDVWCRPCMLRECPLVHRCMRGIDAPAVLPSVREAIAAGPAPLS